MILTSVTIKRSTKPIVGSSSSALRRWVPYKHDILYHINVDLNHNNIGVEFHVLLFCTCTYQIIMIV